MNTNPAVEWLSVLRSYVEATGANSMSADIGAGVTVLWHRERGGRVMTPSGVLTVPADALDEQRWLLVAAEADASAGEEM